MERKVMLPWSRLSVMTVVFAALVLTAGSAGATVIRVPADYPKVQQAIDAASSTDTVLVAAGRYAPSTNSESFPIRMKNGVRLIGAGAPACTLDQIGHSRVGDGVINCSGISDTATRIEGFTITNGPSVYGGGICCEHSSPTITNNVITGNSADVGGGIYCWYSSPTITNNVITGNSARYATGGGIYCWESNPTIANNVITGNSSSRAGGGICCYYKSNPTITDNTITGNSARSGKGGGGIYCNLSSPTITNNVITGNSARYGGGIYFKHSVSPTITNNTITGNSAVHDGGGIFCYVSSPTITYNDVWGNASQDYYRCGPGTGCISADPLFVDPAAGDYHLQSGSPCIDAGDNNAPGLQEFDLDGKPRILDGDGDGIAVVDMGAFEYGVPAGDVGSVSIDAPPDLIRVGATHTPQATVYNFSKIPATFDVACLFDSSGTIVYADTVGVVDLGSGESTSVSFADWTAGPDGGITYTMTVVTLLENDINPDNDTMTKIITIVIEASIDFDPDKLNLKGKGKWVTCYIELPSDHSVEDINTSTVAITRINGEGLDPRLYREGPTEIGDYDDDGGADLMVKFDREKLIDILKSMGYGDGDVVELTVGGKLLNGKLFAGSDTVEIIDKGKDGG